MWRYGRWLPILGDPQDPDRLHEAIQPFADGAQDLDEHDFAAGGITNAKLESMIFADDAGVEPDHQGTNITAPTFLNAQEHEANVGWTPITGTQVDATFGGGLLWLIGMAQFSLDISKSSYNAQVHLGILIDGKLWHVVDHPEASEDLDNVLWGTSDLCSVYAVDLVIPISAGNHLVELAIMVIGDASAYTHCAQLGAIELRA